MALHCKLLKQLNTSLAELDKTLVFLGVPPAPNPAAGAAQRILIFTNKINRIIDKTCQIFDFATPANIFSAAHVTVLDGIIHDEVGTPSGISSTDVNDIAGLITDAIDRRYYNVAYHKCCLLVYIHCVRIESFLDKQGLNVPLSRAFDRSCSNMLAVALRVSQDYWSRVRVEREEDVQLDQQDKEAFLAGFVRVLYPVFDPDKMFTSMSNRKPKFFRDLRSALIANEYDTLVSRLDDFFAHEYDGSDNEHDDYGPIRRLGP